MSNLPRSTQRVSRKNNRLGGMMAKKKSKTKTVTKNLPAQLGLRLDFPAKVTSIDLELKEKLVEAGLRTPRKARVEDPGYEEQPGGRCQRQWGRQPLIRISEDR